VTGASVGTSVLIVGCSVLEAGTSDGDGVGSSVGAPEGLSDGFTGSKQMW